MTHIPTTTTRFSEGNFRVGQVLNRGFSVLSRNFLIFFIVAALAYLPTLLLYRSMASSPGALLGLMPLTPVVLNFPLSLLSQSIVLYGAFQDMRGRPVKLGESVRIALQRFLPIIGLVLVVLLIAAIGFGALILISLAGGAPGAIISFIVLMVAAMTLLTLWFVAVPICVVERLGPVATLGRSARLTKGHRWKIFGLGLLLILTSTIIGRVVDFLLVYYLLGSIGGILAMMIGQLIWNGVWGAFYAIVVVVTYHDLRAAKEGIDIEQIAAVFD